MTDGQQATPRPIGFARAAMLAAVGIALAGGVRFAYSVLLGRWVGPELLGQANAGIAIATVATMLGPGALGAAASKFLARALATDPGGGEVRVVWHHLLGRVLRLSALLALLAAAASLVLLDTTPVEAGWLAVLVLTFALAALTRGAAFGRGRIKITVSGEIANAAVALGLLAAALATGVVSEASPGAVLAPLALGSLAYAAITWPRFGPRAPKPVTGAGRASRPREVDAFVVWGVVGNVASAGLLHLSLIAAAATTNPESVGLYAAAVAVATPAAALAQPLAQVLFPRMASADARRDLGGVRRQTDLATRGLVVLMVAVTGTVVVLAESLLVVVYGPEFAPAAAMLRIVAIAVLIATVTVAAVTSMTSGDPRGIRITAMVSSIGLAVGAVLAAILVPVLRATGAAVAYGGGTVVTNLVLWVMVWASQKQPWGWLTARLALAVAAMLGCGIGVTWLAPGNLLVEIVVAAGFVVGWLLLSWTDVRMLRGARRR